MRYWMTVLVSAVIVAGCGSSSVENELVEVITDELGNVITDELDSVINEIESINIDYSLIGCEDDLTTVLALINIKRTEVHSCGVDSLGPVAEVSWNESLTLAAEDHSSNMANYDFFDHTGLDNSTVSTRVTDQGYSWSYVAENIAAGQTTAEEVVDGWMASEGHCKNIMSENVTEMGLACVSNSSATYNYYWTQVFAKPL